MNTMARVTLVVAVALASVCEVARGDEERSVGARIGSFLRKADQHVQQELDRRPEVRKRLTKGIDVFADNVIDAVEPDADENARRVAREGVQMLLNPSRTESDRAFQNMRRALTNGATRTRNSTTQHRPSTRSAGHRSVSSETSARRHGTPSSGSPGFELPPAILAIGQAEWHGQLWGRADQGLHVASASVGRSLPRAHATLMEALVQAGMPTNAAATLATTLMGAVALLVLYLVLVFPRRRLKRENRQLRRQLETERTIRGQTV